MSSPPAPPSSGESHSTAISAPFGENSNDLPLTLLTRRGSNAVDDDNQDDHGYHQLRSVYNAEVESGHFGESDSLRPFVPKVGPTKKKFSRIRNISIQSPWLWELLASMFSLVCMAVVVIVLLQENGKRLDHWALYFTPNATISFITTLAKSSAVLVLGAVLGQLRWMHFAATPRMLSDLQTFDEASRGPLGAVKLIIRIKSAALLATCASILIIIALLIDFSAQLVFDWPLRLTPTDRQNASIQVAWDYNAMTQWQAGHPMMLPAPGNAPFQLQAAVVSAAFGIEPAFDLSCPTANCTFAPLTTIGVCHRCEDVTARSTETCEPDMLSGKLCHIRTPSSLIPSTMVSRHWSYDAAGLNAVAMNSSSTWSYPITPGWPSSAPLGSPILSNFTAVKVHIEGGDRGGYPEPKLLVVTQCQVTLCLKTYANITVRNGQTKAGTIGESPLSFTKIVGNGTAVGLAMQTKSANSETNSTYYINLFDFGNIQEYMLNVFGGSAIYDSGSVQPASESQIVDASPKLAPSIITAMYLATNLSSLMRNISDSMTNSIRTSQRDFTIIPGAALVEETYIQIRWEYLALPIAVSVLSLVLCLLVITRSRAQGVEAWKESTLPLLFYRLEGWEGSIQNFKNGEELEASSKGMKSRMSLDSGHRVFVRAGYIAPNRT